MSVAVFWKPDLKLAGRRGEIDANYAGIYACGCLEPILAAVGQRSVAGIDADTK